MFPKAERGRRGSEQSALPAHGKTDERQLSDAEADAGRNLNFLSSPGNACGFSGSSGLLSHKQTRELIQKRKQSKPVETEKSYLVPRLLLFQIQ